MKRLTDNKSSWLGNGVKLLLILVIYGCVMVVIDGQLVGRQMLSLIVPICINIILAVSLNLATGFLGELTLGHAGFMSIGAYTGALITLNANMPEPAALAVGLAAGGLMAALFGLIIGVPVLRLKGDYLAIVTLAFGEIIKSVINSLSITNGAQGLSGISTLTNYRHFTIVFILTVVTVVLISNLVRSRHGRVICSVRDNEIAAEATGVPVSKVKIMAFVISAFFAGIAGVIYAHNVGILKPTNFDYNKSIEILVIVVLGGMGSIRGSIIAAILITVLPEILRGADDLRMLLYSVVLIAMMLFNHSKIKERINDKLEQRKKSRKEA